MTSQPDPKDGPPDALREAALAIVAIDDEAGPSKRGRPDYITFIPGDKIEALRAALRVVPPEGGPQAEGWTLKRDPARPDWPGVLLVTEDAENIVIPIAAGRPRNFSDSFKLACRFLAALRASGAGTRQEEPQYDTSYSRDRDNPFPSPKRGEPPQ